MNEVLERLLAESFAKRLSAIAAEILDLLKPTLSALERRYMEEVGPEIERKRAAHFEYSYLGSCDQSRQLSREIRKLEEEAKVLLESSGRQELLGALTEDILLLRPPRKVEDVTFRLRDGSENLKRYLGTARTVGASTESIRFLEELQRATA